jgi:hypothetical protein
MTVGFAGELRASANIHFTAQRNQPFVRNLLDIGLWSLELTR